MPAVALPDGRRTQRSTKTGNRREAQKIVSEWSALSQQFHDVLVSAGLAAPRPPKWKAQGKGRETAQVRSEVTFHSLRHTATSLLKNAGVSEAVARDIIGHESAAISRHYTHIDEESKRKALAKLPDITAPSPTKKKPNST